VRQFKVFRGGKIAKRLAQIAYLCAHPIEHFRCVSAIRKCGMPAGLNAMKYLGDYLTRTLAPARRRDALRSHYERLRYFIPPLTPSDLQEGVLIWTRHVAADGPPLRLVLEPARYAAMEGELQLRFAFKSDLYVLTFLFAAGHIFERQDPTVIFIGGVQGLIGAREEIREAAKLNGEIDPATMLIIALQALAAGTGVDEIIAVGEEDQVSMGYAREKISLDYRGFWLDLGAAPCGRHYRLPLTFTHKPLAEIPGPHRRRSKRKRRDKQLIRQEIDGRVAQLVG
jgi:uncharacterized protein VirK/YbjX